MDKLLSSSAFDKREAQPFTKEMYKALCEYTSNEWNREVLNGVRLSIINPDKCELVATDGHGAVHYRNVSLASFNDFIIDELGVNIVSSIDCSQLHHTIYIEPKQRKKLKKQIVSDDTYPNYERIVPDSFDNHLHSLPTFGIDQLKRIDKCFSFGYYLPDGWNGLHGATVKYLDDTKQNYILVMPIRITSWSHEPRLEAWRSQCSKLNK